MLKCRKNSTKNELKILKFYYLNRKCLQSTREVLYTTVIRLYNDFKRVENDHLITIITHNRLEISRTSELCVILQRFTV